jgi:hypothetical protein
MIRIMIRSLTRVKQSFKTEILIMHSIHSDSELAERYSRQILLHNWGISKQRKLSALVMTIDCNIPSLIMYATALGVERYIFTDRSRYEKSLLDHVRLFNKNISVVSKVSTENCDVLVTDSLEIFREHTCRMKFYIRYNPDRSCDIHFSDREQNITDKKIRSLNSTYIALEWLIGCTIILDISRLY